MEHSPGSATGTAWDRTPWHAVQRAAWAALDKREVATGSTYERGAIPKLGSLTIYDRS